MDKPQIEKIIELEDSVEAVRQMSLEERGRLLAVACRAAMQIEQGRLASGLPPSQPAPWPDSTWDFLRKHASNARQ